MSDDVVELMARAAFESFQETQDAHLRRDAWDSQIGKGLQPYHRAAIKAAIAALSHDHANLGFLIKSALGPDVWCMTVNIGGGKVCPIAFSLDQAREISRRIHEQLTEKAT